MSSERIYLDYAATTPVDPRVLEAMQPYFMQHFGNPSSHHGWGLHAQQAIDSSRQQVAESLNCAPEEIIFTACGSESDNLALRGAAFAARQERDANRILTSPVEHPAILNTAKQLESIHDFQLELLPIDRFGLVDPQILADRISPDVAAVSIIYANNEIGSIHPISELSQICREHQVPLHTDAVQAASQLPIDVESLGVDLMSLGSHKFYGPKGIGALYIRSGISLVPALTGGGQEYGLRSGTHNTPLIVGFSEALRITLAERQEHNRHFLQLREHLISQVIDSIPDVLLTGHPDHRLPNHASFVFRHIQGHQLVEVLDREGFGCSSGSACKTGDPEPSFVIQALGIDPSFALGSLRITLGRHTRMDHIDALLKVLPTVIQDLRSSKHGNP
ncbi:MAG TPA: cysteine desulfurase [Anaerolineae bacterium]|nr:cysteine desulfurase [Anaerolineae bacterium]